MDEKIELTLDVGEVPAAETAITESTQQEEKYMSEVRLTEAEQKAVEEFSKKIDLRNSDIVLGYGSACQKKIAEFSDTALEGVKTRDLGEVGGLISDLVTELKGFSVEPEEKGLLGFFKKSGNKLEALKAKYAGAEVNVDKIVGVLEDHENRLVKDVVMLDKMYEANLNHFKELTMYIIAGKKALEEGRSVTLPELKSKAASSGLSEDAQAANDYAALCDRFEKKLHDLELTRTVSMQMAPQIRLIQNGDSLMVEKIQSTVNNTIPLWKNQMVLALGMEHSKQAMEAQREVNDFTNELLKKNADALKLGTTQIAQESERGIIDIETVRYTNEQLINTLDEVMRIQTEGRQKRLEAENELARIESSVRGKLLDIRNG